MTPTMRTCPCGQRFKSNGKRKRFCSRDCQNKGRYATPDLEPNIHIVIPDTQVKQGVPNDHLQWIGRWVAERYEGVPNVKLIHLGDHWDMPSLSSYDRGKKAMEGRRYLEDIEAGNRGFELLNDPIKAAEEASGVTFDKHFLFGNHEERIVRAAEADAQLDGLLSLDQLDTKGWQRHEFRAPVDLDGVVYAHYFYNANTGRPYGGENVELRLKTIGHSFTMGHQQGLKIGMRYVNGRQQVGMVAGSCYQHEEEYLGPQGNNHWRGIVACNNVEGGSYDFMTIKLDYLCQRFEGHRIADHAGREL